MTDRTVPIRPAYPKLLVAVLALSGVSASFMQTILIPIQPQLPQLLHASGQDTAWVITATLVAAAISSPIAGRLGDMYGKQRIAMVLLVLQLCGAILAALSDTLAPMIIARVLQGVAAGVIPLGIAILRDVLPPQRLGSAIALISATLGVGGALGLPISALVAANLDWHALFWIAAALTLACLVLYAKVVPAGSLRAAGRLDFVGIAGLTVGLVSALIAVSRGGQWGWGDPRTLILFVGGIAILILWGIFELRVTDPLVDLRASASRPVLLTNLASVAMGFALFASSIVFPQLLQLPLATGVGLGLSLVAAALVLAPAGLAMMAMAPVAGRIQRARGSKTLLIVGTFVIAISYGSALLFHAAFWQILIVNTLLGAGIGLGYAAMPALIMQAVSPSETGAANGLNALMRSLGTSIAAAVVGAVLAQSATNTGNNLGPSETGFMITLTLGLAAALLCIVIASFIPQRRIQKDGRASMGTSAMSTAAFANSSQSRR
ncbi:MFS transporter [Pengzhenrongella sicca]|uniref:MFS transporter n=1 Tax=Pengzhenrongella sicca TaxID=2819238 RepID=A0A8A4ZKM9_9MICO|nr:MFS transporter [Pengzhenrongella sicca]QTE31077.1 MFS transporter [Pengzhenrongella sicca]